MDDHDREHHGDGDTTDHGALAPARRSSPPRARSTKTRDPFDGFDLIDRAAVYLRVSLDRNGDERAVSRQREDAQAVARMRGWEVAAEYIDNSVSASKAEVIRPEYERMRRDYRAGKFSAIICYDLDRLTRQPRQLEDWIDEAERAGLVIVTLNGEADLGTDAGRLFARIKAAVARSEVERKSARHKRANLQRAERGYWQFSRRPYGYERRDGRVEIVEAEAEIVREGYRRYIAGDSYYAIANDWNARGVPTFTGPWSMERVRSMLRNPRYAGIVEYKGKRLDVTPEWVPLIDERVWSDYLETREGRTRAGSWSTSTKHLLSGLLVCGVCGGRMLARPDRGRQVYSCTTNWCTSIGAGDVDPVVEGLILRRLADKEIVKRLRHVPDTAPLQTELAALRKRREDITDLLADGILDRRRARQQATELTAKIDATAARLASMRRESPLTDLALARSVPARWGRLGVLERRRVIEELGLRVAIEKGKPGRRPVDADGRMLPDLRRIITTWVDSDLGEMAPSDVD